MLRGYYCTSIVVYVYGTARSCTECAREILKLRNNLIHLKQFTATEPLAFVAIDILCELIRTKIRKILLLAITDLLKN